MYVGRDFDHADPMESERFSFDFINDMQLGDTITAAMWACSVAAKSMLDDPDAALCVNGPAVFSSTQTSQRVMNMRPGTTYVLTASVRTAALDILTLWSHVECRLPK
jgi:hypothetical protein